MPQFVVFCISIMLYMFGMAVVYQCAPALASQSGKINHLLLLISVTDFRFAFSVNKKLLKFRHFTG